MKRKNEVMPTEEEEQAAVVEYLELLQQQGRVILFSAVPASTYTTSWNQKRKNYVQGVRKGVPDLIVVLWGCILFIEMKRKKGGVVSKEQKAWIEAINEVDNVEARVCKGFEQAKDFIDMNLH